jgi:hypothetical protein
MDGRVIRQIIIQHDSDISVWAQAVAESKQPPFAFYVKKSLDPIRTKDDQIGENALYDVYCVATSYSGAEDMAVKVKHSMLTHTNPVTWTEGSSTVSESIDHISLEDENDEYDEEVGIYAKVLTFKLLKIY